MTRDAADVLAAGVSPADVLAASETAIPLTVEDKAARSRLAAAGVGFLKACRETVTAAAGFGDMAKAVAELLEPERRSAVSAAIRFRAAEATSELIQIRAIHRNLGRPLDNVLEVIVSQRSASGTSLDALTRDLKIKGLNAPPGYTVDQGGVWEDEGEQGPVAHSPILITAVARDLHTSTARLEVAWRRGRRWVREWVDRGEVMDSRRIVRLADLEAPVHSDNARDVVRYLAAFEQANLAALPSTTTTSRLGWQGDGPSFVLPTRCIGPDDIQFTSRGVESIVDGYRPHGTLEGWKAAIAPALKHPKAVLGILAAASTPLLHILKQPGFVVDWSGETSRGKTTTLRIATSVWGLPDDRDGGLILSWASSSTVGPMVVAAVLCHLPVVLDDTKRAKPHVAGTVCYDIPAGRSRLQGKQDGGLRASGQWRTNLLSTGEAPITSFASDGAGAHARVLAVRGSPVDTREEAERLTRGLLEHHGHLGPAWLEHLVEHADHGKLRARFEVLRATHAAKAETEVQGRMAAYVAILALTLEELQRVRLLPAVPCDPIAEAMGAVVEGGQEADRPAEAMGWLRAWAVGNQRAFWGRQEQDSQGYLIGRPPPNGWVGCWARDTDWDFLGVQRAVLERLLGDWGFDVQGVIEAWRRRGWLSGDSDKNGREKLTKTVWIDGASARVVAIRRASLDV